MELYRNAKIAIPSHNRADKINDYVLKYLFNEGIITNNIYVFVSEIEIPEYRNQILSKYSGINIISSKLGLCNNRDFIKSYFKDGEWIIYLDDDIKGICTKSEGNFNDFIKSSIEYMYLKNIRLMGVNPTGNLFFCQEKIISGLYLVVGCCYIEYNIHNLYFADGWLLDEKEDYYRTLTYFLNGYNIARNDNWTVQHKYKTLSGGMNGQNRNQNNNSAMELLKKLDPYNLITFKNKKNGQEILFNSRTHKEYNVNRKHRINDGKYISDAAIKITPSHYKTIIYDGDRPIAIIYKNVLKDKWKNDNFKNLMEYTKFYTSTQRGPLAGQIIPELLPKYDRDLHEKGLLKYSIDGTKVINSKYDVYNPVKCVSLGFSKWRGKIRQIKKSEKIEKKGLSACINEYSAIVSQLMKMDTENGLIPKYETDLNYKYKNGFFSTLTINRSVQCATHRDLNQIGWASMIVFRTDDNYSGLDILFPDYDLLIKLDDGDIIEFDSSNILHSNTPKMDKMGNIVSDVDIGRYSIIFFNKI